MLPQSWAIGFQDGTELTSHCCLWTRDLGFSPSMPSLGQSACPHEHGSWFPSECVTAPVPCWELQCFNGLACKLGTVICGVHSRFSSSMYKGVNTRRWGSWYGDTLGHGYCKCYNITAYDVRPIIGVLLIVRCVNWMLKRCHHLIRLHLHANTQKRSWLRTS